ncbi:unnamed protein product [Arctogadus glacialis]
MGTEGTLYTAAPLEPPAHTLWPNPVPTLHNKQSPRAPTVLRRNSGRERRREEGEEEHREHSGLENAGAA